MQIFDNESISSSLNETAKRILKLGSSSGDGVILKVENRFEVFIQSGTDSYKFIKTDGRIRAEYDEAMDQLLSGGFILANNSRQNSYQLTSKGYEYTERL